MELIWYYKNNNEMVKPLKLINALRKSDEYITIIFTEGSCYQFHLFLKKIYPGGEPYISLLRNHIVTKIEGKFYDINGIVIERENMYSPLREHDLPMVRKWSFKKNHLLKITDCPNCDEPIGR